MIIPQDPFILLSFINTKLRDFYPTLNELCKSMQIEQTDLTEKLAAVEYKYDAGLNQFV